MKDKTSAICVFVALSFVIVSGSTLEKLEIVPTTDAVKFDKNTTTVIPTTPSTTTTVVPTKPSTTSEIPTTPSTTTTTISPTPKPPTPEPQTGMWLWTDPKQNITCIVVQMAVQWNVTYITNNVSARVQQTVFNLPIDKVNVVNGSCANNTQFIELQWAESSTSINNVTIYFAKNESVHKYAIDKMEFNFSLNSSYFPNALDTKSFSLLMTEEVFSVPLSRSYRCAHRQTFNLTLANRGDDDSRSQVTISNLQEQAFLAEKGHSFGSAMDCDGSDVPDAVPIGVGVALAVAVLLVLIGYLIGRRRSQARGYLSM